MQNSQPTFFWPLRLVAVLSLLAPGLVFSYATWENHRALDLQANERIERTLDVLQEHALKALQTVERAISEINEALRGYSDEQIRASESDLFLRFKRTQQALPQIESIWAFDKDGHPLVSSTVLPVPRALNNSDRSYFRAQRSSDNGAYISEVIRARVGLLHVFVVSGRRHGDEAGKFNGVIGVTVMPEHFNEFYRKLSRGHDSFALVRAGGDFLARLPETRSANLGAFSLLPRAIQNNPEYGLLTAASPLDGVERRIGYRKVPGFPVYVQTGIETAALSTEFWTMVLGQLGVGFPAVLAVFSLSIYALRRAQRHEEESIRRQLAEGALKQAQRLEGLGRLTGGVAHDFNNLLMVVSGNIERVKRTLAADDRLIQNVQAIETAVARGAELTRQLLSFSRRQAREAKVIDLSLRLPALQEMLQSSLRGDIRVHADVAPGLWRTKIDISEFELALLNLAVNARDAMKSGGRLTISARNHTLLKPNGLNLEGDFVVVTVHDTGSGIPTDLISRVFEPFFTTKEVGQGTGLGLSQVYGFAQQAGGAATIASEVGAGTTVALYVPRSFEPLQQEQASDGTVHGRMGEEATILLVEDNIDVTDVTRGYLEEFGYTVVSASDVKSALQILRVPKQHIDLVLTDIVMPGSEDGLDLARWIRTHYAERLPVVLATGYSESAQTALDEGFTMLRKPYDAATLRNVLAYALRKGRRKGAA